MHDPTPERVAPRQLSRPLTPTIALLATLAMSLLPAGAALAATPTEPYGQQPVTVERAAKPATPVAPVGRRAGDPRAAEPPKAVIIVGPVEGLSNMYLGYGELWAERAEAQGMDVRRLFTPNATWSAVLDNIQGAKLVVFLGHGNGWPSPYSPFQEDTKDGFGLNASAGAGHENVKYYGANFIRRSVNLAENAIVVLGHACYSAGTGESWQAEPSLSVARERVDNFAAGFLAAGARTYFAYYFEQTRNMVADLFDSHKTMDELFMQPGGSATYSGYSGTNAPYSDSIRTPGARIHLDQAPGYGWYRAIAGDLQMTTDEWLGAPVEPDTVAPDLSRFKPVASTVTFATGGPASTRPVVFTPNGDGTTDSVGVATTLSESSYVDVVIQDLADNRTVRRFTSWVTLGAGSVTWDGRKTDSTFVPDGDYKLTATPRDRAGNVGASAFAEVAARTSLRAPSATPALFFGRDGDTLAPSTRLDIRLTRSAVVSWKMFDRAGELIAVNLDKVETAPGVLTWTWDGRKADGTWASDGLFWSTVTATTDSGSYRHRFAVTHSAFKLYAPVSTAAAGTRVTFTVTSAETLMQNPTVMVSQPGLSPYRIFTTKTGTNRYRADITFKPGGPGAANLRVWGFDVDERGQGSDFSFTVD